MINPSDLQLSSLPWVPLDSTAGFPAKPGIYFAIDPQGCVQYIGRSGDVRGRWKNHHRYEELEGIGGVKIAYLFVDTVELLPSVEAALIEWFDPPLNVMLKRSPTSKYGKYDEAKHGKQFMLTDTASTAIDALAQELGISRSEVVERAARCGGMLAAKKYNPETGVCDQPQSSNSED